MTPPSGAQIIVYFAFASAHRPDATDERELEERDGLGAPNGDLTHVRQIEEARGRAHRDVLRNVAGVANRHFPAGEVDEGGAERNVLSRGVGSDAGSRHHGT